MTVQKDKAYLEAGVAELENYLLSKALYYPIGYHLPQLTLGGILLSLARLRGMGLAGRFEERFASIRSKRRAAWEAKADREVRARSGMWSDYLAEYREDPGGNVHLYSQEVPQRAMIELLKPEIQRPPQELADLDSYLRNVWEDGRFIWEHEVQNGFPHDTFWFLYGKLKG